MRVTYPHTSGITNVHPSVTVDNGRLTFVVVC